MFLNEEPKSINEWISYARRFQGLSVAELARLSDVSRQTLHGIESSERDPSFATAEKILKVLGLKLSLSADMSHWSYLDDVIEKKVAIRRNRLVEPLRACFFSLNADKNLKDYEKRLTTLKILFKATSLSMPRLFQKLKRMPNLKHFGFAFLKPQNQVAFDMTKKSLKEQIKDDRRGTRPGPVPLQ